jgi:hypothetical protein
MPTPQPISRRRVSAPTLQQVSSVSVAVVPPRCLVKPHEACRSKYATEGAGCGDGSVGRVELMSNLLLGRFTLHTPLQAGHEGWVCVLRDGPRGNKDTETAEGKEVC